jgi:hypothetical protein
MVNALVIRRSTQLAKAHKALRAAQYARLSTDHQQYSIENQAVVIGHTLRRTTSPSFERIVTKAKAG